ncbi:hypothetical protein L873DRAFT_835768 [Choiromyces venosus 120613-1]|uniref:Uncharacterized protein n=1 Tax=Choiromyces venosus 120613-1 TaxID=1336337 RepID=A0A3N4JSF2_9PEZI|nr:hypothetical protein L873DRAFT_835768 [Choiromyces venosus 120613-1]
MKEKNRFPSTLIYIYLHGGKLRKHRKHRNSQFNLPTAKPRKGKQMRGRQIPGESASHDIPLMPSLFSLPYKAASNLPQLINEETGNNSEAHSSSLPTGDRSGLLHVV